MVKFTKPQLKKKCDELLTPIAKLNNKFCEAGCGRKTQVGHHWIEKGRSNRLRYDIDNIVSLCNVCHSQIHNNFRNNVVQSIDIAMTIINKRGKDWYDRMKLLQPEKVITNKEYYVNEFNRLTRIKNELENL